MKQIGSEIITSLAAQSSKIGTQVGEAGLQTRSSSEIAEWLAGHKPEDLDRAAVSRAQLLGVDLEVKLEGRYPVGQNGERLPGYTVAVACAVTGSDENRAAALRTLENFQTPASVVQIENWLAELSVLTAGRGPDGISAELLVTAFSSRLSQYPADVVRHALLRESWKWFPSWAELERVCEAKSGPRRQMIAALAKPAPEPETERRPPTQEERDRIAALIAEKFPNAPQAWRDSAAQEATSGKCIAESNTDREGAQT